MCHEFGTTGLRSCKVTISFYDCFVVTFAFTLVSLLPVCFKVRLRLSRVDLNDLNPYRTDFHDFPLQNRPIASRYGINFNKPMSSNNNMMNGRSDLPDICPGS